MELIQELKKLNLTEKEAAVYLGLLTLGPSTPYEVAKYCGLKRPTTYVIAEELVEKGLILQLASEKKKKHIARSPEDYIKEAEGRITEVRRALPKLVALQKKTSEKPSILYYEGLEGLKQAYEYRLKDFHNTEILAFAARPDDFNEKILKYVSFPWHEYREKHNIKVRIVTVDTPKLRSFKDILSNKKFLSARYLPEELYNSDCTLECFSWG